MVEMHQASQWTRREYQDCLLGLNGLIRMNVAYRGRLEPLESQGTVENY